MPGSSEDLKNFPNAQWKPKVIKMNAYQNASTTKTENISTFFET
jgi:hypothetical protein